MNIKVIHLPLPTAITKSLTPTCDHTCFKYSSSSCLKFTNGISLRIEEEGL